VIGHLRAMLADQLIYWAFRLDPSRELAKLIERRALDAAQEAGR
jgi:hypothetical protein